MPKEKKPKPLPKRISRIVERCKSGERLHCQFRPRALGDADGVRAYWFEPSGATCGSYSARQAIELGLVVPSDTGLFSASDAQTYVAAQV